jgi:hypothetical protein
LGIQKIEIENTLGSRGKNQTGSALTVAELDGAAGLLTAQDTDQSGTQAAVADDLLNQILFAMGTLEVVVGSVVLGSETLSVGNELLGFLLQEGDKVLAGNAESMIHEGVETPFIAKGEMPLEEDSIGAGENGDDGRSELDEKRIGRIHGVLLQKGDSATPF